MRGLILFALAVPVAFYVRFMVAMHHEMRRYNSRAVQLGSPLSSEMRLRKLEFEFSDAERRKIRFSTGVEWSRHA
jgi:hypothetical protein